MNPLRWPIEIDLGVEYQINNRVAEEAARKGFEEICSSYTYLTPNLVGQVLRQLPEVWGALSGTGIDLGGGPGCISAAVAGASAVDLVYCLEIVEVAVTECQPIIFNSLRTEIKRKIISVIGDYNKLLLETDSLDFAIMWDSLHHSTDPVRTLAEARRVIRPGGSLVIVDRAHDDSTPDSQIEEWLNIEYDSDFKRRNYLEPDQVVTRRMNGEHEWRFHEIFEFIDQAGFQVDFAQGVASQTLPKNDRNIPEVLIPIDLGGFYKKKFAFVCS